MNEIIKKIKKAKSDSELFPENLKNLEKNPNIYSEVTKKSLETRF